ncbi:hypothetical protein [Pseudonocardia spinosispora]|uniref:hypothetical protein n=1 Tax=Pseudonocardia spinosispora TaxID=103441 RepID=UPI00040F999B|nr:hypothetical protein [Pseudonocardia spinosispora]
MSRISKTGFATTLTATVMLSAVLFSGMAYASDDDDSSGGSSHRGADGKAGTATAHCNEKPNLELANPLQCTENPKSKSAQSNAKGGHSSKGADGANGTSTHNGRSITNTPKSD